MSDEMKIIEILKDDGIGVIPTDTIYGLVGRAFSQEAVKKIYRVKGRDQMKPLIILISYLEDLEKFGVVLSEKTELFLKKVWPGKVSVILPFSNVDFKYLSRNGDSLAFRLPDDKRLLEISRAVGPLVAPSANPEGLQPARNIKEAEDYFGEKIDFYLDCGELESLPSTLVEVRGGDMKVLREGCVKV